MEMGRVSHGPTDTSSRIGSGPSGRDRSIPSSKIPETNPTRGTPPENGQFYHRKDTSGHPRGSLWPNARADHTPDTGHQLDSDAPSALVPRTQDTVLDLDPGHRDASQDA